MGYRATRYVEYSFNCDQCGKSETLFTGDTSKDIFVYDTATAFKAAEFHRHKNIILCDRCFKNTKKNGV